MPKYYGFKKAPGASYAELPILNADGPLVKTAIWNFARKVFCALYYKHSGIILPSSGAMAVHWFTNLKIENDEIPRSLSNLLSGFPRLKRARTNLDDQFFYRWCVFEAKEQAVFLAFFRQSFAILGHLNQSAENFNVPEGIQILRPLSYDEP